MIIPSRLAAAFVLLVLPALNSAGAQTVPPPIPSILPPPPPPSGPPPPKIEVPEVPKLSAPPPKARSEPRRSLHQRIERCLEDAHAARLAPGERVAYSSYCANRVE